MGIRFVKHGFQLLNRWRVLFLAMLVILGSSWSLMNNSFFRVHDFTHAARLSEMLTALQDGHFPVRWSRNLGYGYGMPLFNFYGPLPYYIGVIPYFFGLSVVSVMKLMLLGLNIVTFTGAYLLGKKLYGSSGGLIAATVMTMFPYRAVDMYVRGAWNELFAIAFFSWVFLAVLQLREKLSWRNVAVLALTLAAVCCSHNLMTMMFLPAAYGWGLWNLWKSKHRKNFFIYLHAGWVLGILLSAFYLLPAFSEKGFTKVDSAVLGGYFDFHLHFLYIRQWFQGTWGWGGSNYGPDDGISFALGVVPLILSVIGMLALFLRTRGKRIFAVFLISITVASLLLTTQKSQLVWDSFSLMKYFQFPWRFLSLVILGMGLLSGAVVYWIQSKMARVIISGICCLLMIISQLQNFRPEKFLDDPADFYNVAAERTQRLISEILPDYIPASVQKLPVLGLPLTESASGDFSKIDVQVDRVQEKLLLVDVNKPSVLIVRIFTFPGWKVYIDGLSSSFDISPEGWFKISLPAGSHKVSLRFENTMIRNLGNSLSLAGLIIVGSILLYDRRSRN